LGIVARSNGNRRKEAKRRHHKSRKLTSHNDGVLRENISDYAH
jgi:hypothetical protein